MYVCICNSVTDRQIRKAAARGVRTVEQLGEELKVATCCGRCRDCARGILDEAHREPEPMSFVPMPAPA